MMMRTSLGREVVLLLTFQAPTATLLMDWYKAPLGSSVSGIKGCHPQVQHTGASGHLGSNLLIC